MEYIYLLVPFYRSYVRYNLFFFFTDVISVSPPFQLATNVPVLDSIKDIAPVENPTATSVSAGFTAITRMTPVIIELDFHTCNDK